MYKAQQFWIWFAKNKAVYTFLPSIDPDIKNEYLNKLLEQLHLYCDELYFEIGGFPDEEQELIITAEGKTDYFTKVYELIEQAPMLKGWKFIGLKQPIKEDYITSWGTLKMSTKDIWFLPLEGDDPTKTGIRIYLKGYAQLNENESLKPLILKVIDTAAGEKSAALDIDYIDFDEQPNDPAGEDLMPILELSDYLNWLKSNSQEH